LPRTLGFLCCIAKGIHLFVRSAVKPKTDQRVQTRIASSGR
jgi:hypothetical protein